MANTPEHSNATDSRPRVGEDYFGIALAGPLRAALDCRQHELQKKCDDKNNDEKFKNRVP